MADRALAEDLVGEVRRHGGTLQANYLPAVRPDLRKRLGDGKLLQFVALFPDLLQVRPWHGGHLLCSCEGDPSTAQTKKAVGQAPSGATRPGPGQGQLSERAVHALRQLERELIQRLSTRLKSSETAAVDVAWLLHNGKIRRRIGAVVRFHPIPELFVQTALAKASETAEDGEDDDATPQRGVSSSCPLSDHARTYAGYLLQFLRDRHELFQLCPAHGGDRPVCIYGDACCSCRMRVSILPEGWKMLNSLADDEDLEALIQLVAQKVSQLTTACGSQKVPLVRLGRDADVKKALRGRALLSFLDADARRQAAAGHGPRLRLETSSATFLIALQPGAFKLEEAAPALPTANRNRRMAAPPSICLLGEAPGLAVLRKPPKVTTEALLEALQSHFDQQNLARQVISVSRLDRDTSGVLVAATSTEGADCLTEQFKAHSVFKRYLALCSGWVADARGQINAKLYISGFAEKYRAYVSPKGKESVTDFEVLAYLSRPCDAVGSKATPACDDLGRAVSAYAASKAADKECYTLLACYPRTGRTHQIRAHLEFRGHPLVSDANYNPRGQVRRQFAWCPRLWLHCEQMVFKDCQGAMQTFRAPVPDDLLEALSALEGLDATLLAELKS
ncbi:truC [Symbiodinium sp. CCMP2592]|nr:truC [Symbiodinium sp. CCMP2592]